MTCSNTYNRTGTVPLPEAMSQEALKTTIHDVPSDDPRRVLENAVVRLLKKKPFYGHLLLGFRRHYDSGPHAIGGTVVNVSPTL
jgi:hypothetical protein